MSNELIPVSEIQAMASAVAKSGYFPAFGTVDKAFTLMMVAQAEGCHPMQAVQRYDVIQGKPAKKTDAMLADYQRLGGKVTWDVLTDQECRATFEAPGLGKPVTLSWTIAMATAAKLSNKDNWKNYPRAMLRARVVSEGIRTAMPGVVAGLYSPEEVQDFSAPVSLAPPPAGTPTVVDAEVVQPQEPKASPEQIKALCAAMNGIGIKDREDVLSWCEERIGRKVGSRKDLTAPECSKLIDDAKAVKPSEPGSNG